MDATVEVVNCHHNYVEREHHFGKNVFITRKGMVRARKGDLAIRWAGSVHQGITAPG